MKKQFVIILTVVCGLMFTLMLAACGQPSTASSSDAADSSAASSATEVAAADSDGYTGLPTLQPADHEGRTADMCPTCHAEGSGGAPAIPEDHFVDGDIDPNRLQCITCHVLEPAA